VNGPAPPRARQLITAIPASRNFASWKGFDSSRRLVLY
jgi:hypothetical protein